ncbi:MAG: HEAT repeat domain-containing protein [Planctomycetota bacterium]
MARRLSDVSPGRVRELNAGAPASNLMESLTVDFAKLLRGAVPGLPASGVDTMRAARGEGYTKRMRIASAILLEHAGESAIEALGAHPSDTVRGWACYAVGSVAPDVDDALRRVRVFAGDAHYGVREWAWLGVRAHVVAQPRRALDLLEAWATDDDANIRRFASEATRPRGVWCAHIAELKSDPSPALPLLEALRADDHKYVQDSVANWLNDASKTRPEWTVGVCERWRAGSPVLATERICRRALRTLSRD